MSFLIRKALPIFLFFRFCFFLRMGYFINTQFSDTVLFHIFYHNPQIEAMLTGKEKQVLQGNLTSFVAAKNLLDTYFAELKK